MAWLLDTNIISETRRLKPEPKVLAFLARHPLEDLYISSVSLAELRFGVELLSEGSSRRDELDKWLAQEIRPMFDRRVLPVTEDVMLRWRILIEAGRRAGHTYSQPDLIIAATALHHNLTVATRDRSDFERAGVQVFNPWTD
jgi:predicted nucleic acid-binding protein